MSTFCLQISLMPRPRSKEGMEYAFCGSGDPCLTRQPLNHPECIQTYK
mgnify:CR=1 FL=1